MINEPVHVTDAQFEESVLKSSIPVVVDFWAPWCGPCKMVAPVLDKIAREQAGKLIVAKVNTDEEPEWATRFGVQGIPTMLFIANGKIVHRQVGALPEKVLRDVLQATVPYNVESRKGPTLRAKVDFLVFENAKMRVRALAESAGFDGLATRHGYPHFFYLDDAAPADQAHSSLATFDLTGPAVRSFANYAFSSDVEALAPGQAQKTCVYTPQGAVDGVLACAADNAYRLSVPVNQAALVAAWLRDLSDGFVHFDADLTRRMPGPVLVQSATEGPVTADSDQPVAAQKPYFIGMTGSGGSGKALPSFVWEEKEAVLKRTSLYETHRKAGARMVPFAGWEMPVQYTSILEEHMATRKAAGLFDVSHMGVYQAEGPEAAAFLDSVCGNDVAALEVGESLYTHFLDPEANVIDDTLVYRRGEEQYLVVVNASNDDKDWAWLNAVREGRVLVDTARPWARAYGRDVTLRNLRDPKEGKDMRVDIALQGPKSRDILLALGVDAANRKRIMALKRTELCEATVGGFDLVVSRTGYTGERMAFELFVHPEQAPALWDRLVEAGTPLGLKPCGLGARDSLRTEAGLPLYGHEMGGERSLGVAEAGFGSYVKIYKPWFIGRDAYVAREKRRNGVVARFRFTEKGVRVAHPGDPVLDPKGRVVGVVTSCAIDSEGYLTGQAFVDAKMSVEGTLVSIYQGAPKAAGIAPAELKSGDRVTLPTPALIVSRFAKLA